MATAGKVLTKQKATRKVHIVPRLLLANFADSHGVLSVYTKDKQVWQSIPDSECWERDFYEYELNGRRTNNKYEDWLAAVEGNACRVLPRLTSRQHLSQQDAIVWSAFVASLFARTRKVRKQISDAMIRKFKQQTEDPDFIRTMQYELLQRGELCYADDLRKDAEKLCAAMDGSPSFFLIVMLLALMLAMLLISDLRPTSLKSVLVWWVRKRRYRCLSAHDSAAS